MCKKLQPETCMDFEKFLKDLEEDNDNIRKHTDETVDIIRTSFRERGIQAGSQILVNICSKTNKISILAGFGKYSLFYFYFLI